MLLSGYQTIELYQITVFNTGMDDVCGRFTSTRHIFQNVRACEFIRQYNIVTYCTQDANSYLLRSKDENDVPVFGCHYLIQVRVSW